VPLVDNFGPNSKMVQNQLADFDEILVMEIFAGLAVCLKNTNGLNLNVTATITK